MELLSKQSSSLSIASQFYEVEVHGVKNYFINQLSTMNTFLLFCIILCIASFRIYRTLTGEGKEAYNDRERHCAHTFKSL